MSPLHGEVRPVVRADLVVVDSDRVAALLLEAREVEDEDAAGVVVGVVVVHVGAERVLDLDPRDVREGLVVPDDDLL